MAKRKNDAKRKISASNFNENCFIAKFRAIRLFHFLYNNQKQH